MMKPFAGVLNKPADCSVGLPANQPYPAALAVGACATERVGQHGVSHRA